MANSDKQVVVIGAGASGLAAAYRLQQAGCVVTVLEAEPGPGGKMRTVHRDGYQIDEGPLVMSRNYTAILSLAREVGLGPEILEANAVFGFPRAGMIHTFDAGRIIRDGMRTGLISAGQRARLGRVVVDCLRHRRALKTGELAALESLDVESAAEYAIRTLGRDVNDFVVDPALRGLCSSSPEELSVLDLWYCFHNFLGIPRAYAFQHGMASYARAVAGRLDVRYQATVVSLKHAADHVRVTWRSADGTESTQDFAGAVIATPADVTRRIHTGLDKASSEFLDSIRYTPLININLGLARQPDVGGAVFILTPRSQVPDLIGIIVEHTKVPGRAPRGKGHVVLGASARLSHELWEAGDQECVQTLIRAAAPVVEIPPEDVEMAHVNRWPAVSLISPPGYYRRLADFQRREAAQHPRIRLASDYFCTSNVNSATAAGERAARALISATTGP